jgi:hypothetical protein
MKTATRYCSLAIFILIFISARSNKSPQDFPIQSIPIIQVRREDHFWSRRIETNRAQSIRLEAVMPPDFTSGILEWNVN